MEALVTPAGLMDVLEAVTFKLVVIVAEEMAAAEIVAVEIVEKVDVMVLNVPEP